jgi:hypothetical protein
MPANSGRGAAATDAGSKPADPGPEPVACPTTDREPDKIIDGVKIFVHWIEPTAAQREAMLTWYREVIGATLARKVNQAKRSSEH